MKIKGAVKFFAIALAVVCLFQLSFTFVAKRIEAKADAFAHGNMDKKRRYLDSVSRETIFNLGYGKFSLHSYNYLDVKERELNLGLDLRGGINVTLEVAEDKLLRQLSHNNTDSQFVKALNAAKQEAVHSQRNYVDIFYDNIRKANPNVLLANYFYSVEQTTSGIKRDTKNDEVVVWLKEQVKNALDRTFKILRTRVDKFGVTQPNIQQDVNRGRIIVELPGANDPKRVRDLLKKSAKLEFYETYKLNELAPFLEQANKALVAYNLANKIKRNDAAAIAQARKDSVAKVKTDSVDKLIAAAGKDTVQLKALNAAKAKLAPKKNSAEDVPLYALLRISQDFANTPIMARVKVSDTAEVNRVLNIPDVKSVFPAELKPSWMAKTSKQSRDVIDLVALKTTGIKDKEAVLAGDVIIDAKEDVDRTTNAFIVSMQMNAEGATEWAAITGRNVGKAIAIVLDGNVYSAPNVNNPIPNGNSQIQGDFSSEEAKDLANILTAGKLPVELDIIDQAVIGPTMGAEAINKGLASLIIGLIAIILFMVAYYNRGGWVANVAVLINLFFIIGVLTSLQAALTLPGMAGIVLTLAMAVDANVLIYERIREELAHGKSMRIAIADGFKMALSSILDGNITTLLIGIILMTFGSGPIYGFAVVLVIGILTSLFTSILVSRLFFDWLLAKEKKVNFGNSISNNIFRHINFDFVGKRKIGYWFSGITLALAIFSLTTRGLNYGVEFKGGRSYTISFLTKTPGIEELRTNLTHTFGHAPEIKTYGAANRLNITTDYMIDKADEADSAVTATLNKGLAGMGYHEKTDYKIDQTNKVGSTIANDIKTSAFWSIILGLLVVFLYIVVRFKRWQFALGATLALGHDSIFVLGLFSIFKDVLPFMEVDQAIVAAILTVIGYSVNDTVVVFDRIREFLRNNKKSPMIPTVNSAINQTLNRTVITSLTVFIVVLILFIFGGHTIRGFAFAMLIGIVVGTYSSIFVATPIAVDLHSKEDQESAPAM